jgi:hypothetical protein
MGPIGLLGVSTILCAGPGEPSRLNEPFVENDGELGFCLELRARVVFHISCSLAQDEKQAFRRGFIGRKMTSRAHGPA